MLWLSSPPWGRWALAFLITCGALWVEFRPDPLVDHPFATQAISSGQEVGPWNTEMRRVPAGLLGEAITPGVALRDIETDEPILGSSIGQEDDRIPLGWWSIEVELPDRAMAGDDARIVLLDTGAVVSGIVVDAASDDPLGDGRGSLAVTPADAAAVAGAVAEGRAMVMIGTG